MDNITLACIAAHQQVSSRCLVDGIADRNRGINEAIDSINFLAEVQRASLASEFVSQLLSRVNNFKSQLDESQEVGVNLICGGKNTFSVSGVAPVNSSLIIFTGFTEDGKQVELLQHISQITCALIARPKPKPEQQKQKIGYIN